MAADTMLLCNEWGAQSTTTTTRGREEGRGGERGWKERKGANFPNKSESFDLVTDPTRSRP